MTRARFALKTIPILLVAVAGLFAMSPIRDSVAQQPTPFRSRQAVQPPPAPADPSVFTVARLQYPGGGDWYWGSSALPNLLDYIAANTDIAVNKEEVRVKPSDPKLFSYPFIFSTGHGNIHFSDEEVVTMRRYLTGGGFWHINDSYGMDQAIRRELKRIFPDRELVELPYSHPIFQSPYAFPNGVPKIHQHDGKPAQAFGILDGDRVVVFYDYESDIGDGWEDPQVHKDPPEKREAALRMGCNLAFYALTH